MSPLYDRQVDKLESILRRRRILSFVLTMLLFGLPLISALLLVGKAGWIAWQPIEVCAEALTISFCVAWVLHMHRRRSVLDDLIDIDFRHGLQSRLSTAYEHRRRATQSPFVGELVKEAGQVMQRFSPAALAPGALRRVHLLIPVFALVLIGAVWIEVPVGGTVHPSGLQEREADPITAARQEKVTRAAPIARGEARTPLDKTDLHLEEILRQARENPGDRSRLITALENARNLLSAEQTRLIERIRSQVDSRQGGDVSGGQRYSADAFGPDESQKMAELVKKVFGGRIPAAVAESLAGLEKTENRRRILNRILQELQSGKETAAVPQPETIPEGTPNGKARRDDRQPDGIGSSERRTAASSALQPGDQRRTAGPQDENTAPDTGSEGDQAGDQPFPAAGSAAAEGRSKVASGLESSEGTIVREEGLPGEGDRHRVPVRALTRIGRAALPDSAAGKSYRREMEALLHREDIPLNYRQYIKTYFLSIGIGKESTDDASAE